MLDTFVFEYIVAVGGIGDIEAADIVGDEDAVVASAVKELLAAEPFAFELDTIFAVAVE